MQIDIPPADEHKLAQLAAEAGFESVERFVTQHVRTLAQHPAMINLTPPSPKDLQASLEMCDRGMAEMDAGGGRDAREALLELGHKRGFAVDE